MAAVTGTTAEGRPGTGEMVEERVPTTVTATGRDTIQIISSSSQSISPSSNITPTATPINADIHHEPPAYSDVPPSPSSPVSLTQTRSSSPPPPPLPPSPVILPIRITLPATRPASFPLLSHLNLPNNTPRPHTLQLPPPPTSHPRPHSIAIDIFSEDDSQPHDEPLPRYSRYPKRGESHCIGEIGGVDGDNQSENSESVWDDDRSRRTRGKGIYCLGEGIYMRTMIAGIVLLILACAIAGGVVGWKLKTNFENSSRNTQDSAPVNDSGEEGRGPYDGGNVDYWTPPSSSLSILGPTLTPSPTVDSELDIPFATELTLLPTQTKVFVTIHVRGSGPEPTGTPATSEDS